MTTAELATFAGLSTATMLIFEAAKRVLNWNAATLDRFGVVVAVGIGEALAISAALATGGNPFDAALGGLFAGLMAVGIYKAAQASPLPVG